MTAPADETEIARLMLALVAERDPGKSVDPAEIARALGGPHPDGWGPLMRVVRSVAVRLMKEGQLVILRKNKPVDDPESFRGVYRLKGIERIAQ